MWYWGLVALLGIMSLYVIGRDQIKLAILFRVLSAALLLVLLIQESSSSTVIFVALGVVLSSVFDIFYFLHRRSKFCFFSMLLAQIFYSIVFWMQFSNQAIWWLLALLAATGVVVFFLFLPQINRLIFPITIMGAVLIQLSWISGEIWLQLQTSGSFYGFMGSLILLLSMGIWGINYHRDTISCRYYLVSAGSLCTQLLISASVIL